MKFRHYIPNFHGVHCRYRHSAGDREALELERLYAVCHGAGEAWLLVDGIIALPAMSELDAMNAFATSTSPIFMVWPDCGGQWFRRNVPFR